MRGTFDIGVPNAPMGHSMEHSMGGTRDHIPIGALLI